MPSHSMLNVNKRNVKAINKKIVNKKLCKNCFVNVHVLFHNCKFLNCDILNHQFHVPAPGHRSGSTKGSCSANNHKTPLSPQCANYLNCVRILSSEGSGSDAQHLCPAEDTLFCSEARDNTTLSKDGCICVNELGTAGKAGNLSNKSPIHPASRPVTIGAMLSKTLERRSLKSVVTPHNHHLQTMTTEDEGHSDRFEHTGKSRSNSSSATPHLIYRPRESKPNMVDVGSRDCTGNGVDGEEEVPIFHNVENCLCVRNLLNFEKICGVFCKNKCSFCDKIVYNNKYKHIVNCPSFVNLLAERCNAYHCTVGGVPVPAFTGNDKIKHCYSNSVLRKIKTCLKKLYGVNAHIRSHQSLDGASAHYGCLGNTEAQMRMLPPADMGSLKDDKNCKIAPVCDSSDETSGYSSDDSTHWYAELSAYKKMEKEMEKKSPYRGQFNKVKKVYKSLDDFTEEELDDPANKNKVDKFKMVEFVKNVSWSYECRLYKKLPKGLFKGCKNRVEAKIKFDNFMFENHVNVQYEHGLEYVFIHLPRLSCATERDIPRRIPVVQLDRSKQTNNARIGNKRFTVALSHYQHICDGSFFMPNHVLPASHRQFYIVDDVNGGKWGPFNKNIDSHTTDIVYHSIDNDFSWFENIKPAAHREGYVYVLRETKPFLSGNMDAKLHIMDCKTVLFDGKMYASTFIKYDKNSKLHEKLIHLAGFENKFIFSGKCIVCENFANDCTCANEATKLKEFEEYYCVRCYTKASNCGCREKLVYHPNKGVAQSLNVNPLDCVLFNTIPASEDEFKDDAKQIGSSDKKLVMVFLPLTSDRKPKF